MGLSAENFVKCLSSWKIIKAIVILRNLRQLRWLANTVKVIKIYTGHIMIYSGQRIFGSDFFHNFGGHVPVHQIKNNDAHLPHAINLFLHYFYYHKRKIKGNIQQERRTKMIISTGEVSSNHLGLRI